MAMLITTRMLRIMNMSCVASVNACGPKIPPYWCSHIIIPQGSSARKSAEAVETVDTVPARCTASLR
jgi:hypothetical protein